VTRTTAFTLSVTLAVASVGSSAPSTNTAGGVTYYVATNGSNSNTCTDAQNVKTPKLTIAAGIACLRANPLNNRLEIRGGTYKEMLRSADGLLWPQGSNWSNAPIISNYSNETVTLNPSGEEILQVGNNTAYLIFNGIIFDAVNNRPGTDPDFGILGGNTTINSGANHIRFTNSEFKNSGGSGMFVESDFLELINCKFHHNGDTGGDHGIYWSGGSDGLIEGSEFYNNSGYGLHVYDGTRRNLPSRNVFRNNFFHSQGTGIIISSNGSDNSVYNNIVMNNMSGIEISYGASRTKVYNNTVFNNHQAGIAIDATVRDSIIRNNILYQNGATGGIADFGTGMGTVKSNNLTTDPKFVNPAGSDFRLQSLSPAINAGAVLLEVSTDFDGRFRPQGVTYDIGAFEY
jgi:parallel beta-helix repeat protein